MFASLVDPLSFEILLGSGTTYSNELIDVNTSPAASISALSVGPISIDDIPILDVEKDGDVITLIPSAGLHGKELEVIPEHSLAE